ncbi:CU044_5270 family protein [Sanguibacter suarezii]|uniref:CU044_5270 family protein n=1 Tax=Sanguibacter suarezii TaxID=60921 RepID=UPI00082F01A0|nr:CU044_5270 family protein [Sanguibacter suarezii]
MNLDTLAQKAGDVAGPTPDALVAGRQQMDAAITAASARVTAVRRSRRPRRWGIAALAGAAATAVAVLAVPLFGASPASAEEVLLAAAEAAGQQVDEAAGAAYWHVVSEVYYPDTQPFPREIWQGRFEESVLSNGLNAALAAGDGALDPALIRAEGIDGPAAFGIAGGVLSWEDLEALPTDAAELEAHLRKMASGQESGEENALWESVTALLVESPASPALRRALWQVAANMPDVELVGAMTDSAGRQGTAVERNQLDAGRDRAVYILDPTDGTLLEIQNIDADGKVVYRLTQLDQQPSMTAPVPQPPICGPGSVPEHSC